MAQQSVYDELKERLPLPLVLGTYIGQVPAPNDKGMIRMGCPICGHTGRCFSINTARNLFNCFHSESGAAGSVIDLVMAFEDLAKEDAARHLQKVLPAIPQSKTAPKKKSKPRVKREKPQKQPPESVVEECLDV